jgi:DNA-binding NarL/FixJ family response regulator
MNTKITPREKQVLDGLASGKSYNDIAVDNYISLSRVIRHMENIYKKLGVSDRKVIDQVHSIYIN